MLYRFFVLIFIVAFFALNPSLAIEDEINAAQDVVEADIQPQDKLVVKITFEDVLKKAKDHSYDLKIADFNTLIAKQGIRDARSEYFPKLNLGVGTEYTHNYRDSKDTTVMALGDNYINPYTRFQSVLGITLSYNLFDFGVRKGQLDIAKEDTTLKELQEKEQFQELTLNLIDSYTKILLTTKQIDYYKEIKALQEKNLEYSERLFNAKFISQPELNSARTSLEETKRQLSELNSIRAESLGWLSFYTGENYDPQNLEAQDIKRGDFDIYAFKDYTKSLVWLINEKQIKKKELELQVAKRVNYPKVMAYSRYYLYGSDKISYNDSLSDIGPSNYSVGGYVNIPVFDGFKNSANIKKVFYELQQAQIERDKAIAQLMSRLSVMRSNIMYLDEQTTNNGKISKELSAKSNSLSKLASKKVVTPIEANNAKVELLKHKIEIAKNSTTAAAITKGIEILTQEYTN